MMPATKAGTTVVYLERSWDGTKVVTTQTTRRDVPAFPEGTTVAGGWYFLGRDVTVNGRLSLQDGTHLIMGSQKTLDVKGLYIPQGKTLYVYGMSGDSGKIYSHPSGGAGIGAYSGRKGGNLVVYGGTIDATGYNHCAGICGGSYLDYSGGDMRGKIIFNCTPDSWIEATGGHNFNAPYKSGAAIGGGSTQEWARNHQIPFIRE